MNVSGFQPFSAFFPLGIVLVVFGFVAVTRYLRYLERRAYYDALARGASRPPDALRAEDPPLDPAGSPACGRWPGFWRRNGRGGLQGGVTTAAVGLALLLGLATLGFGPWLIGGLIPLFVGLVQILFALLERR